jgi:predicted RNA binding protein YcfA (HicA-like mRNA interferase family)
MSRRDKLLEKLRNNRNNVSFADVEALLLLCGYKLARSAGSHFIYQRASCPPINITRHGDQARPAAVKEVLEILDEYGLDG